MKKYLTAFVMLFLLLECGGKSDYNQALIAEQAHRYDNALELYQKVVDEHPNSGYADKARMKISEIYLVKARKSLADGKLEKAQEEYKKASEILPETEKEQKDKIADEQRIKLTERMEAQFIAQLKANSGIPDLSISPDGSELTLYYENPKNPMELARFYALGQLFGERNVKSSLFDRYPRMNKVILHSYRLEKGEKKILFSYTVSRDAVKDITNEHSDDMLYMFRDARYYAQPGKFYGTGEVELETNFFAVKFINWVQAYVTYSGPGAEKLEIKTPEDPGKEDEPVKKRRIQAVEF
ncbi:MAG: hypothetical protein Kow0090_19980 [Myxococcota bacterium]